MRGRNKIMIKRNIFTLVILLTLINAYGNIGGAVKKPALVGRLACFDIPQVSIVNENIKIKAYRKRNGNYFADFTSEYLIVSKSNEIQNISGVFYGMRSKDIKIQIADTSIKTDFDSLTLNSLDSLFKEKVAIKRYYPQRWFDWEEINRTGYSFQIQPLDTLIIKITGILKGEYTNYWGLAELGSMVRYKHPWANDKSKQKNIQFEYLLEPISSWDSVGSIRIDFSYPKDWYVESNISDVDDGFIKQKIRSNKEIDSGYVTFSSVLKDSFPERIEFSYTEKLPHFYPGGPEFGFGGSKNEGFILHYRWETAFDINRWIAIMPGIGIESNFNDAYKFVPMVKINYLLLYLFGFRTGYVYDIKKDKSAFRAGLSLDLTILGVSWDWDYYSVEKKWRKTISGTISF